MANQPRPDNRGHTVRFEDNIWDRLADLAREDTAATETRVTTSSLLQTAAEQYLTRREAAKRRRKG